MVRVRRSTERGYVEQDWLKSFHTFSFGEYYDPEHMGFHALRVINEDWVAPGRGFDMHPHRDMEILTYVLEGALAHRDSMGNSAVIRLGEVQRMSAGTGVTHSEVNASQTEPVHLLQIWLTPNRLGLPPSYEEARFPAEEHGVLRRVASPTGSDGAVTIHQDASVYRALLHPGESVTHHLATGRSAWLHVVRGDLTLGDAQLWPGDAAAVSDAGPLTVSATKEAEVLLFDLA